MTDGFIIVFVPSGGKRRDIEEVLQRYVDPPKAADGAAATRPEIIEDAEQMPLWRWFTF